MSHEKLINNLAELETGIQACVENKLLRPALTLLYAAIDIAAWLASDDPSVGKRFTTWVDEYLLRAKPMPCTAADLYGARCGMVHTFTPDSRMSGHYRARLLFYSWGNRSATDLQKLIVLAKMDDRYVCVQIEELFDAWKLGCKRLIEQMQQDPDRAARVYEQARKFFDDGSTARIDSLVERYGSARSQ